MRIPSDLLTPPTGPAKLRARTLGTLRWISVCGQAIALIAATQLWGVQISIALSVFLIGLPVLVNIAIWVIWPATKRLSPLEALAMLMFDLIQMGLLLLIHGGVANPFSIFLLVPVVVGASALPFRLFAILIAATLVMIGLNTLAPVPLHSAEVFFHMPDSLRSGMWVALSWAALFIAIYTHRVSKEEQALNTALAATQLALGREQKLTALGGVVAAAAHELGTPLATIKMTAAELADELTGDHAEDIALIRDQAERCRKILHDMGRKPFDEDHIHEAPLRAVVEEAAGPHLHRGKLLVFNEIGYGPHPMLARRPEIIHGLRNIIQNAVDFADTTVTIDLSWSADFKRATIRDDGPGFPPDQVDKIGEPFFGTADARRAGYKGMGMGLFIALTLLESTDARVTFAASDHGAIVEVQWLVTN
ncbi:ActS/PrrB/RegB family redox-sensitive histidine kinase [Paracoccaceae bacterium GXU_MW_L88]